MASVNKAIILGNLGRDPELKFTQTGTPVCTLNIATNEKWKDQQGNWQDKTEWHRVIVWGNTGEACAQHLRKGSSVFVEGGLQTRKWTDQNGQERYTTEIRAFSVQFLDSRNGQSQQTQQGQSQYQQPTPQQQQGSNQGQRQQQSLQQGTLSQKDMGPAFPSEATGMDDVPFLFFLPFGLFLFKLLTAGGGLV